MDHTLKLAIGVEIYAALFLSVVFGAWLWRISRRDERLPLEFKLLRGPGETLRRTVQAIDEDLLIKAILLALVPIVAGYALLFGLLRVAPKWPVQELSIVALLFFVGVFFSGRTIFRKLSQRRRCLLGYLGERAVGEELAVLATEGYRIFHDLPAKSNGRDFNIDHVVVGPTGLFAIETKTRRKGRTRSGFESHLVTYDGRQLIWPWGENRDGLDQAEAQARWLSGEINRLTGLGVAAKPVLAIPGWFVVMKAVGTVVVVNHRHSQLRGAIVGKGNRLFSDEQIDLVARQLDARCRNVED